MRQTQHPPQPQPAPNPPPTDADAISFPFPPPPSLYHPTPELAEIRRNQPVARVTFPDGRTGWLVTSHADVRQVLIDPRFSRAATTAPDTPKTPLDALVSESLLGLDPPEHTRLRKLVARAFTARRVETLRPRVAELVDEMIDGMQRLPRPVDLVENFSLPLPVRVICALLGVPAEDQHLFHTWSDQAMSDGLRHPDRVQAGVAELMAYFRTLIAAKRAAPADDLVSALIAARDEGDKLSEQELVRMSFGLLVAGHETTANQINMMLLTLLYHPEQLDRLRAEPDRMGQAIEELMRFTQLGDGGTGLPRIALEDVELSGVTIPAGSAVLPVLSIANRDPDVYPEPDRLDLARGPAQHVGFGAGAHHCLGAPLARMELQEALGGLLRRMPHIRLAVPETELRFKPGMVVRSLETLPVTW